MPKNIHDAQMLAFAAYDAALAKDYAKAARLYDLSAETYPLPYTPKTRKAVKLARSYASTYARAKG
jgi:hypothetical protein